MPDSSDPECPQANGKPYFPKATYTRWIVKTQVNPGYATPKQVERYKEAVKWYDDRKIP
jgi:hypothetical protein